MDAHFENILNIVDGGNEYPLNFPQLTGQMHPIQYSCSMSGANNNDIGNIANNSNKFSHNNNNNNNDLSYSNRHYTNLNTRYMITNSPRKRLESIRIRPYFIPDRLRTKSENAAE